MDKVDKPSGVAGARNKLVEVCRVGHDISDDDAYFVNKDSLEKILIKFLLVKK